MVFKLSTKSIKVKIRPRAEKLESKVWLEFKFGNAGWSFLSLQFGRSGVYFLFSYFISNHLSTMIIYKDIFNGKLIRNHYSFIFDTFVELSVYWYRINEG